MAKQTGDFESSTIWIEVQDIIRASKNKILYDYRGILHTEKEDYPVLDLSVIEYYRNYLTDIGDTVRIRFLMGMGDYVNRLYPYRSNLEFTLKRIPLAENGSGSAKNQSIEVTRYKAIFNPGNNPPVGGSELETYDPQTLNVSSLQEIHLELADRALEPLRIKTLGGAYQRKKPDEMVRALVAGEATKILVDGRPALDAIEVVAADNKEPVPDLVIPDGTRLTALPTFLQNQVGVYGRGIGTYFQKYKGKKTLFVYPTYDTERFDEGKSTRAIFYMVPQEKLPQLDRSYQVDGNILKIAITAQRKYQDTGELSYMNEGSGFRMADARAYMKKPVVITPEGPKASRAELNHEVVIKERKDGLNYAPFTTSVPSSNPFVQRSLVLQRTMAKMELVWENADPELLYPGMPCKVVYLSQGKPVSLKGTVLFMHAMTARVERRGAAAFRMTCKVGLACEPQTKTPDLPVTENVGEPESISEFI